LARADEAIEMSVFDRLNMESTKGTQLTDGLQEGDWCSSDKAGHHREQSKCEEDELHGGDLRDFRVYRLVTLKEWIDRSVVKTIDSAVIVVVVIVAVLL
jgi:hypothetical protein